MIYASVCDGIGAAHVAWQPLGWRCAWTSEIDPFPAAVVDHHWGFPNLGDMTRITDGQLAEHGRIDLLVGGTPCQSFSVAGLRKGLADPRGNLALVYLGLVDRIRPRWVVWENVPGVLSSGRGRDFGAFLGALGELGYGWAYRVLDAQYVRVESHPYAVPQRRRRVFVVGCLGDWRRAGAVLLERESLCGHPPPRREAGQGLAADAAPSLVASGRGVERTGETRGQDPVVATLAIRGRGGCSTLEYRIDETANAVLTPSGGRGGIGVGAVAHTLKAEGFDASEDGTGRGTPLVPEVFGTLAANDGAKWGSNQWADEGKAVIGFANTAGATNLGIQDGVMPPITTRNGDPGMIACGWDEAQITSKANRTRVDPSQPMSTLAKNGRPSVIANMHVRRLTPRECERLQGFPDDYTAIQYRGKPAADGPRYKALGNSMARNVMEWIGRRIQAVAP